jgi:hypothetical protein
MQCRVNDVIVNDTPKFLTSDPTDHMHAMTIKDPDHPAQMVILPLALQRVTLLLNVRAPTLDEWNSDAFKRLHLTSESLTWDPTTTFYEEQEAAIIDYSGHVMTMMLPLRGHVNNLVINLLSSLTSDQADVTNDDDFYQVLASHVQISSIETSLNGHICLRKIVSIDPQTLAARWMISPERGKHTVVMTMQRGVPESHPFMAISNMTECFGTSMCCILCSVTPCLLGPCHNKATKWPRCMLRLLVGQVLTP